MLRVTVDINGRGVCEVCAVRRTEGIEGVNTYDIYDTTDKNPDSLSGIDSIGSVEHKYEDGCAVLARKTIAYVQDNYRIS